MKKKLSAVVLLVSFMFLVSGCGIGKARLVNSQEFPIKDIKDVSVSYNSDSVNFYENDTDEIRVEEYLLTNKKVAKADIKIDRKSISIKGGKRQGLWFTFNDDSHIDIYLPKDYHESLRVTIKSGAVKGSEFLELSELTGKANSGSLKFSGIKADKVTLAITSGSIKVDQLQGHESEISSNSGSIKLGDVISSQLVGQTTSGSIKINKYKGNAELTAKSGSIKLDEITGSANLKVTSGSIKASFQKVNGDILAEANSGSIKIDVPKKLSFNFESDVNSGSVRTDFDDELSKNGQQKNGVVGHDAEMTLMTKVTSGSIKINRR